MAKCTRCGRALKDEKSIAREMGPVCYRLSGGGIFEGDLQADDAEWARREEFLKKGGEIDLGVNWRYPLGDGTWRQMRVSVRFKDGAFEAYGSLAPDEDEVVFDTGSDIRGVYRSAVHAGPHYTAVAEYDRRLAARKHRAEQKKKAS